MWDRDNPNQYDPITGGDVTSPVRWLRRSVAAVLPTRPSGGVAGELVRATGPSIIYMIEEIEKIGRIERSSRDSSGQAAAISWAPHL